MKKIIIFSAILLTFTIVASPALARTPLFAQARNSTAAAERQQAKLDAQSDNLKNRATNEINRRIDSLNKLLTRISEFKKLSTTQKSTLTTQVQAQITALNTLLAKINADTDTATLKADVKSIVDSYRIYALFMPQIQILGAADRVLTIIDEMTTHATTLGTKITAAKTAGKDVTDLETLLTDMNAKIADAKTQAQAAIDAVTPLTPAGFPGNKTTLQSARQMVEAAVKDLNMARQDARKIIVGLTKLGTTTTTTATPTP